MVHMIVCTFQSNKGESQRRNIIRRRRREKEEEAVVLCFRYNLTSLDGSFSGEASNS